MLKDFGLHPSLVVLITLIIGLAIGLFNGVLVVGLNVFPMIITLATAFLFKGSAISYLSAVRHG